MKRAVFLIAPKGFQDIELKVTLEMLQEKNIDCTIASTTLDTVTGSLGMEIDPDIMIDEIDPVNYDMIIIIGGPGASLLGENKDVLDLIRAFNEDHKLVTAICISPTILAKAGILKGKRSTVWKSDESVKQLQAGGAEFVDEMVVVDGKIITANGPKAAKPFAEKILEQV